MGTSVAAGYAMAVRLRSTAGLSERWLVAALMAHFIPYSAWSIASLGHGFSEVVAPLVTLTAAAVVLALCHRRRWWRRLGLDLLHVRLALAPGPMLLPLLFMFATALFALAVSVAHVIFYATWSWDCVWYHLAQSRYIIQEQSLHYWVDTSNFYLNGYPRLVETFSAFSMLVLRSEVLDDGSQLSWGLVGCLAVAAFCRRLGISRLLSLAFGVSWLLMPAVFLQLHTTHADVASGALFVSACFFAWSRRAAASALAMAFVCANLLVATKISGLLLVALLTPVVLVQALRSVRTSRKGDWALMHVVVVVVSLFVGAAQPIRNFVHTKNPVYPAAVSLPRLGLRLDGPMEEGAVAGGLSFLRSPGAVGGIIHAWGATPGAPFPDIRERPFGRTFNFFLVPFALVGLLVGFARLRIETLSLLFLAVASLMVPAPWWGRFVLGVPAAALALAGLALDRLSRRLLGGAVVGASTMAGLLVWDYCSAFPGYRQTPELSFGIGGVRNDERLRAEMTWMLPPAMIAARDSELKDGDVFAYDESVEFIGELWNSATTSRAVFVSSKEPSSFLRRLTALGAKWTAVARPSSAEQALAESGGELVGAHPFGRTAYYRLPVKAQPPQTTSPRIPRSKAADAGLE
jgi:hypothetical protein